MFRRRVPSKAISTTLSSKIEARLFRMDGTAKATPFTPVDE